MTLPYLFVAFWALYFMELRLLLLPLLVAYRLDLQRDEALLFKYVIILGKLRCCL